MGAGESTRALVRALDLEARTLFTGLLQGRERLEALADATVLVYPAEDEVFGLVPLEALRRRVHPSSWRAIPAAEKSSA